jgi:hypothetical protein
MPGLRDSGAPRIQTTIEQLVAAAPPLSEEARRRLASLVTRPQVKRR